MVIGIAGSVAITHFPFMESCPIISIFIIILARIDRMERHQSFIINTSCPDIARTYTAVKTGNRVIGILFHKVTVHFFHDFQRFLPVGQRLGTDRNRQRKKE